MAITASPTHILLGTNPLNNQPISGLHTDAMTLHAEVIEVKKKPIYPWGRAVQNAFGQTPQVTQRPSQAQTQRVIVAIGQQDIDPNGLTPPHGYSIAGASSDHLILIGHQRPVAVGQVMRFGVNYSALLRAVTSSYVAKIIKNPAMTSARLMHVSH